jgi:hypothetical protein
MDMSKKEISVIDSHAHCGVMDTSMPQTFEIYLDEIAGTDIGAAAFFSPVLEIYDRFDYNFVDTPERQLRRKESNANLLSLNKSDFKVYPYFFIWNDFAVDQLTEVHCGIKWHRHAGEPEYAYDDPKCLAALDEIRQRNLAIVLEEEFDKTLRFIRELAQGITVIIPHLGRLNGGYEALDEVGIWELENVWADTALAAAYEIKAYLNSHGSEHLMFGSDFPFGSPASELSKIRNLNLDPDIEASLLSKNFLNLQSQINRKN